MGLWFIIEPVRWRSKSAPNTACVDAGDCCFAACGTHGKNFSGFEFSLLPNRIHAHPSAMLRERHRWATRCQRCILEGDELDAKSREVIRVVVA